MAPAHGRTIELVRGRSVSIPKSEYVSMRAVERSMRQAYQLGYWDAIKLVVLLLATAAAIAAVGIVDSGVTVLPW